MNEIKTLLKGANGYESKTFSKTSLIDWFKQNTDGEGNVTEDIIIYQECSIERKGDKLALIMSDYSLDRDQERIDPDGWDLKNYKKNPLILWGHEWYRPAIGHMSTVGKKKIDGETVLVGVPSFSPQEIDPFAWMISEKLLRGDLNTGSVGFRSTKVEIIEDDKEDARLIHRRQELYEYSIVNIPSNVNAEAMRLSAEPDEEKDDEVVINEAIQELANNPAKNAGTYIDGLFENLDHETSDPAKGSETSNLEHMFNDSDDKITIEELLNGN